MPSINLDHLSPADKATAESLLSQLKALNIAIQQDDAFIQGEENAIAEFDREIALSES